MAVFLKPNLSFNQELAAAARSRGITTRPTTRTPPPSPRACPRSRRPSTTTCERAANLDPAGRLSDGVILLVTFRVRWRLLPFAIVAVGPDLGVRTRGLLRHPAHPGHHRRPPVLHGCGHGLRHPDALADRGGGGLNRAAHPIQAAARDLGPALLVVTFDAVFAFMALWFAKVPAVRQFGSLLVIGIIAVCVCSIMLTLAILGIREYRSPTKGRGLRPRRLGRIVVCLGSLPPRAACPMALVRVVFAAGSPSRASSSSRPTPSVGQPPLPGGAAHRRCSKR